MPPPPRSSPSPPCAYSKVPGPASLTDVSLAPTNRCLARSAENSPFGGRATHVFPRVFTDSHCRTAETGLGHSGPPRSPGVFVGLPPSLANMSGFGHTLTQEAALSLTLPWHPSASRQGLRTPAHGFSEFRMRPDGFGWGRICAPVTDSSPSNEARMGLLAERGWPRRVRSAVQANLALGCWKERLVVFGLNGSV